MKKKKQHKEYTARKQIFIVKMGHYPGELICSVGKTFNQCKEFIKKKYPNDSDILKEIENFNPPPHNASGYHLGFETKPFHLFMVKSEKLNWEFYETLIHELYHVVDHASDMGNFRYEKENKAYLHEFLFRAIRRKIT